MSSVAPQQSAGSASTSTTAASASNDALASIITQVQPGQPVRQAAPRRRPTGQKTASSKSTAKPAQSPVNVAAPAPATKAAEVTSEKPLPSPTTAPAPVTSPSSTQARPASPRKKKRKQGFLGSLLAFLTCSSAAAAEQTYRDKDATSREAPAGRIQQQQTASTVETKDQPLPVSSSGPPAASTSAAPLPVTETVDAAALATQETVANTSREGATLPRDETGDVLSSAVVPPGKEGGTPGRRKRKSRGSTPALAAAGGDTTEDQEVSEASEDEEDDEYAEEDEEDRLIMQGGMGIPLDEDGQPRPLLVEMGPIDKGRKCLVLDLDETLVHSSFKMIHQADFIVPVEIENQSHNVYVIKRPGVDTFLQKMGEIYEVVVFTASLSKYADPVLDILDIHRVVRHRLFRESCYNHRGNYVKDLSQLGRPIGETIIIDNSPASYIFHPKNAVPVSSWFNDPHDTELTDLLGVLTDLAAVPDVRGVLDTYLETDTGFGLDQSMEQLSAMATASAQQHSSQQHQQQRSTS